LSFHPEGDISCLLESFRRKIFALLVFPLQSGKAACNLPAFGNQRNTFFALVATTGVSVCQ
jgi:hypothetical protein